MSLIFWTGAYGADPYCAGRGVWVSTEIPCPTWIILCTLPPFVDFFMICVGIYFVIIFIILIGGILLSFEKKNNALHSSKKRSSKN